MFKQVKTDLKAAFPRSLDRRSIGAELELYLVDRRTKAPLPLCGKIRDAMPNELRSQIHEEHMACQVELVSKPATTLRDLRDDLNNLLVHVNRAAAKYGAELLFAGAHPTLRYSEQQLIDNARTQSNIRRLGGLSRQLATAGLHVHIAATADEAMVIRDGLETYLPLLVAMASNSPIWEGEYSGRRSQRAAIWSSGFSVCGLAGRQESWGRYLSRYDRMIKNGRIEGPKDLFDLVRVSGFGTIECRACDCPLDIDHVIALAAITWTLAEAMVTPTSLLRHPLDGDTSALRTELHEAAQRGPEARLTNHCGDLVSPVQYAHRLAYDLQPIATRLGTDLAMRLAPAVLADNGSTRQLGIWKRQQIAERAAARVRREQPVWKPAMALATAGMLFLSASLFAFAAAATWLV
jgi:carboxylate-amine ligase